MFSWTVEGSPKWAKEGSMEAVLDAVSQVNDNCVIKIKELDEKGGAITEWELGKKTKDGFRQLKRVL